MTAVGNLLNIKAYCWHSILELVVLHLPKNTALSCIVKAQEKNLTILIAYVIFRGLRHLFHVTDVASHLDKFC